MELGSLKWKVVKGCLPAHHLSPLKGSCFEPDTLESLAALPSEVGGCWWAHSHPRDEFTLRPHRLTEQKKPCLLTAHPGPSTHRRRWFLMWDSASLSPQLWAKCRSLFCAGQLQSEVPRTPQTQQAPNWPVALVFKGRIDWISRLSAFLLFLHLVCPSASRMPRGKGFYTVRGGFQGSIKGNFYSVDFRYHQTSEINTQVMYLFLFLALIIWEWLFPPCLILNPRQEPLLLFFLAIICSYSLLIFPLGVIFFSLMIYRCSLHIMDIDLFIGQL